MRAAAALSVLLLGACGFSGTGTQSWPEDVDLGDGRILSIDRKIVWTTSDPGRVRSVLELHDGPKALPAWDEALTPLIVYQDAATGEWAVVAIATRCGDSVAPGRPAGRYREFRLQQEGWRQVELSAASIGRDSNLFVGDFKNLPAHVTVAAKQVARQRAGIPREHLRVDRAALGECA